MSVPAPRGRKRGGAAALGASVLVALVALVATLCAGPALGRQTPEAVLRLADAYGLRVTLERQEDFRAGWIDARPVIRERALEHLRSHRDPDSPPWADPLFPVLCEARYLLAGGTIDSYPELQRVADLLDVRLKPGAFEARADGRREPLTVRIAAMDFTDAPRTNRVRLFWVGPDGREVHARDEQVLRPALQPPGFDMYIHAPFSEPGTWSLKAEVRYVNSFGYTRPIEVACVRDLSARVARAAERSADPRAVAVADAVGLGLRAPSGESVAELLAALESDGELAGSAPRPFATFDETPVWELAGAPAAAERAVLLFGPFELPPEARLSGTRGAAWAEAARAADLLVLSTRAPLGAERLAAIRGRLERERGVRRLILVAFGSAVPDATALCPWLPGSSVDGLVLSTALASGTRPPRVLALPTLVLDAVAEEDRLELLGPAPGAGDARTTWVMRRELSLTAELALPGLLVDWLATEAALGAEGEPEGERPR